MTGVLVRRVKRDGATLERRQCEDWAEILMIDQQVKEYEGLVATTRNNLPSSLWREDGPGDALISEFQPLEL